MAMRWPILRALAMSWVIDTAVAPRSLTHFTISSLITSAMIGSRPVVGSSKKMISGSRAIARASATRFCMPPDSSDGNSSAMSGPRPTLPSLAIAISRALAGAMPSLWIGPKATFCQTRSESKRAPPWNSMPNLRITCSRAESPRFAVSSPSILIEPASGSIRPRMHFRSTDLPVPEPPITTTDSPAATSRSMPRSTFLSPNDLVTPRSEIFGTALMSAGEEGFGDEVVGGQDQDRGRHHRVGGGDAHALRAALGRVAVVAAHQGDQEAEHRGLHQAREDILELQEIDGVAQVGGVVE